jgi:hypothetical protein
MKIRWGVLILVVLLGTRICAQVKSQVQDPAESKELNTQAYIQLLREDVQAKREQIIKEGMQLDDKQAAAFWPVYKEYAAAQKQLGDQKLAIIQDYAKEFLTMNDAKANDLAQRVIALDDQRTALRNKYYEAMKKVLPTVLVVRFFQLDGQIQMLIDLQMASNLPIIEELPAKE